MSQNSHATVTVADYLFARLGQLRVDHVFGVPGDFNLLLLEELEALDEPRWVGTANELGAAYAADGYARERGFGALVTTFGVGELSALNGIAGSYAEQVPVLHVVGTPSRGAMDTGLPLHHTLLDGDHGHFQRAFAEVTIAQALLASAGEPAAEIDRVLLTMLDTSLPGYLAIPEDLVHHRVSADRLATPLAPLTSSPFAIAECRHRATALLQGAERVVVLAGGGVARADAEEQLRGLVERADIPFATQLDGKALIDEGHPLSLGIYQGALADPGARAAVEGADVLIRVGARVSDTLSGAFTAQLEAVPTIDVALDHVALAGDVVNSIRLSDALTALGDALDSRMIQNAPISPASPPLPAPRDADAPLRQAALWESVASLIAPGSTVLADAGTSYYGICAERLPRDTRFIGQPVWSSIGYCLPATLGVGLANGSRRPVLLIGDGAAQMTAQEFGALAREGIHPIIVLVDNAGYTIERAIRGPHSSYNDIASWDWDLLIRSLTAGRGEPAILPARTESELTAALHRAQSEADRMVLIHAYADAQDVPRALTAMTEVIARRTAVPEPAGRRAA